MSVDIFAGLDGKKSGTCEAHANPAACLVSLMEHAQWQTNGWGIKSGKGEDENRSIQRRKSACPINRSRRARFEPRCSAGPSIVPT